MTYSADVNGGDFKIRGYTVAQLPNAPIIVAVLAALVSRFLDDGSTGWAIARGVFFIGLTIWSWEELSGGVNGFRRALGALGLAFVMFSMIRDLS